MFLTKVRMLRMYLKGSSLPSHIKWIFCKVHKIIACLFLFFVILHLQKKEKCRTFLLNLNFGQNLQQSVCLLYWKTS
jgi:hypothetical protein